MYSPNFHIVSIDEGSYNKLANGMYAVRIGQECEKYLQNATVEFSIKNSNYKKGDKVYISHLAIDNKMYYKDKPYRAALPEDILCKVEGGQLISHDFVIAEKTYTKDSLGRDKENSNRFRVLYSPFEELEEGDEVYVAEDTDYPIEEISCTFLKRKYLLKNITKDTMLNDHEEVEVIEEDKFLKNKSGIFLANENYNYHVGKHKGKKYFYEKLPYKKLSEGFHATKELLVEL